MIYHVISMSYQANLESLFIIERRYTLAMPITLLKNTLFRRWYTRARTPPRVSK